MKTIPQAIEILDMNIKEAGKKMPLDCKESIQLGIEALAAVGNARTNLFWTPIPLLPGETEE